VEFFYFVAGDLLMFITVVANFCEDTTSIRCGWLLNVGGKKQLLLFFQCKIELFTERKGGGEGMVIFSFTNGKSFFFNAK
jgi:hypothetical protein